MKKMIFFFVSLLVLANVFPMQSSAATVSSGKNYIPSKNYTYTVYDSEGYIQNLKVKCKGPVSMRECINNDYAGYTHLYQNNNLSFGVASSDVFLTPDYKFPMTSGKTYKRTAYNYGEKYSYKYKVEAVNSTKKVGNKTYKHVIRIKNINSNSYTYIAKNHGVILITIKKKGKQIPYYKVKNYTKKIYKTTAVLNVRTGPGTNYKKIGTLKKGQQVTIKGTSGSWYKISYKGQTAYIIKNYVK